jgi:hypothetical protein
MIEFQEKGDCYMSTVTADRALETQLAKLKGLTEVRNSEGSVLGHFLPALSKEELKLYLKVLAEYDPEEIQRRKAVGGTGRTTQEVLARLQSLEKR